MLSNFITNPFSKTYKYDAIIVAVSHQEFINYSTSDFVKISNRKLVLLDLKGIYHNATWKF
jgi:UDP-N-acetyl-D-mannosaminuronate dehydrogenase